MKIRFPQFISSDNELNITYQYRCEVYQRHVKEIPTGFVVTEFLPPVSWAGAYNTISCAACHHFREGRWISETDILEKYADFWCTEGSVRKYSFPIVDSILALVKVTDNFEIAERLYSRLVEIHKEWDDHKTESGLYWQKCNYDGMEFSISGDGVRPTINSYMYADKIGLCKIAARVGDERNAKKYSEEATQLKDLINLILWNDHVGMYGVISSDGTMQNVREQIGYIPWIYGIPPEGRDGCFGYLTDPRCFAARYGLRTADASHPDYRKPFDHECLWNGPVWPFATSQSLTAVIEYLHTAKKPTVSSNDFLKMLLTYAYSHRDTDGTPYIDENMDPDTGVWLAREIMRGGNKPGKNPERGKHYNHSTFIDLVMTGICGIRPDFKNTLSIHPLGTSLGGFSVRDVQYHGRLLDIDWDKSIGLRAVIDNRKEYFAKTEENVTVSVEL